MTDAHGVTERRYGHLPGWDLVRAGLADLGVGRYTIAASLVASASVRLRELGLDVPASSGGGSTRLYELLVAEVGVARAHSRYNALRRRLSSFLGSARYARPD